jgi:aryl-alcohol dehydrogenase-like predicted oxidoreductase
MNIENRMTARPLGRTGLAVSALGFGSFKIGRNRGIKYAESYELPDELALRELMAGVLSLGMCYIDTAPAYGTSEERLGRVLADHGERVVISTKVGETFEGGESCYEFTPESTRASVERVLCGWVARYLTWYLSIPTATILRSRTRVEWLRHCWS